jgi:hypothetical protein
MVDPKDPAVQDALKEASEECGLASHYRSCVHPLLRNPEGRWPRCCGGGCEPCAQTLIDVAHLVLKRLGTPRQAPID